MKHGFLSVFAILSMIAACKPIVRNPIDLGQVAAAHTLPGTRPGAVWRIATHAPTSARTDGVTLPAGSAAAFVSIPGSAIPMEQLLTEDEQKRIGEELLAAISNSVPSSSCVIALTFDGIDYAFHEHQYWADVSMTAEAGGVKVLEGHKRFWSAEGMSTWERLNTTPQRGKRALAAAVLDHFVVLAEGSTHYRKACGSP